MAWWAPSDAINSTWSTKGVDLLNHYHAKKNNGESAQKPELLAPICGDDCPDYQAFCESHSEQVRMLKNRFMSLRNDSRMELAPWCLSQKAQNHTSTNLEMDPFHTKYYYDAVYCILLM